MRRPGVLVSGEGEDVRLWNGMGVPDYFPRFEMPPQVGIVKAVANRQNSQDGKGQRKHDRKRKSAMPDRFQPRSASWSRIEQGSTRVQWGKRQYRLRRH